MSKASMRRRWQTVDGVLLLDKAIGVSSNAALQMARRTFQAAKAGHTGTLDPLATGLLPVMFGEATKFSHMLLDADKTYEATVRLGIVTNTGDAEGEILSQSAVNASEKDILAACRAFVGSIEQVPPMHSALKHEGKALYEYARQGVDIERQARQVVIHELKVSNITADSFGMTVRCSKGTYIRTLAEDIGHSLKCGAHLTALRRIAVGALNINQAVTQNALSQMNDQERQTSLLPLDSLLQHLPSIELEEALALRFLQGQTIAALGATLGEAGVQVCVYAQARHQFLGLADINAFGGLKPSRLVATNENSVLPLS